jgi:flavin-dependent dehydrogenase
VTVLHDVAVIGAGPAGAVVAHVLARLGRKVALVDECRRARGVFAELLPTSAGALLGELDLLDAVTAGPHIAATPDGWHLDRARFDADLVRLAVDAGVTVFTARASTFDLTSSGWLIRGDGIEDDDEAVSARFVVDASGRRAVVATKHGARRITGTPRSAIVVGIENNRNDDDCRRIVEHTTDGGVFVSAPLAGRRRVVALHAREEVARAILRQPIELNLRIRRSALVGPLIHPRAKIGPPVLLESGTARLDRVVGHRWLAVGDAAQSFDPLAGDHGIVRALESALRAAHAIDEAMHDRPAALDTYVETYASAA